ncbi:MAG: DUF1592 domain-containing protein [Vicinamibacterales bacterium]|jgi:hypothetical protein|nr:DUF1592 domain-containing protein [Vicinamibacterales bacterium]
MNVPLASYAGFFALLVFVGSATQPGLASRVPGPAVARLAQAPPATDPNQVVRRTCTTCHNDQSLRGNLSLEHFDVTAAFDDAAVAERMVRKLRAGMMPPPGARRPDGDTLLTLVEALEHNLDAGAAIAPDPGGRTFQRLNRAEYARAIEALLALDVDAGDWLPLDQMSANFDNIADAQTLSPMLLEAYLNAASAISRHAIGESGGPPVDHTYSNSEYISQHPWDQLEGAPYGTRGGMVVDHVFPADAQYVFGLTFTSGANTRLEDVDVSIDGERVALLHYNTDRRVGADGRGGVPTETQPVFVRAGQHRVAAAFIRRADGPYADLIRPHDWSFAGGGSGGSGVTTLPHVRDVIISGPYNVTGLSETPSRQRVFTCRPTGPDEARPCAREIIMRLGREAYRRAPTAQDIDGLMSFYEDGAATGGFEIGVRTALEAMLASPHFVLRLEREPVDAPRRGFRVSDVDLASRLSFFLWGTPPDDELQTLADEGRLSPEKLEGQALRMLADPRAEALGTRFAAQWFRLQDMDKVRPDPNFYPNYDENLAQAMRRETELFFANLVQENRSLLDLYRADYTFVNERLARHYGIPGVAGRQFRRVAYPDDTRRGILGHGSMLVLTSLANRTSPVLRGKWVMEVLLGTPPPPPPADVPALEDTAGAKDGRLLTTRERMELHRSNPSCSSCHRLIDPIGLALDNFDVTGQWRLRENGATLDTRGVFYDGTPVSTPRELVNALLARPVPLVRTFTENLLTFAIGRRVEHFDQPTIRAITRAAEANDYRMASFVMGVVGSDAFQRKRGQ